MNLFQKIIIVISAAALISTCFINAAFADNGRRIGNRFGHGPGHNAKNVIILIPDGCSQSIQTLARWYKGERLALDDLHVGIVKHEMANSVITGSAAAATAFSTGYKTTARFLSVGPRAEDVLSTYEWPEDPATFSYKPLATVMEGANLKGMATGLISTSRFTHATPAAWACHSAERGNGPMDIAEHMVYNEIDLIFGGGMRNLDPGYRPDNDDLRSVLEDRAYNGMIAETAYELKGLSGLPAYGMFAWSHMDSEIDRPQYNPEEPSLSEMTAKAIDLLSQERDGFILMVEGSQVDWAGHNNDPVYMVTDFIEFDNAVKVALDFAKKDGNTLVLAYPDHNTGGMDIGNRGLNGGGADENGAVTHIGYTNLTVEKLLDPIKGMTVTAGALASEIGNDTSFNNVKDTVNTFWDIDIDENEYDEIMAMKDGDAGSLSYALARVISKNHTAIGWTSHGHNAEDVPLWAYGPGAPQGLLDNTELAETVADVLGLNMDRIQKRLFVNLDDAFGPNGWTLDETNPANPVVNISSQLAEAELPISKDILTITTKWGKTKTYDLEGVVAAPILFSPDKALITTPDHVRVYVPRQAVTIMKLHGIQ